MYILPVCAAYWLVPSEQDEWGIEQYQQRGWGADYCDMCIQCSSRGECLCACVCSSLLLLLLLLLHFDISMQPCIYIEGLLGHRLSFIT